MYSAHAQWYASYPLGKRRHFQCPGAKDCSNASAKSILMCGFGTPVFSKLGFFQSEVAANGLIPDLQPVEVLRQRSR